MELRFEQVEPPSTAPLDDNAEDLLLLPGLRAEPRDRQFRCAACSRMQPTGSWLVWVPDGVRKTDPAWSVTEACRLSAFNGHGSGWCLKCAQSFCRPSLNLIRPKAMNRPSVLLSLYVGIPVVGIWMVVLWLGSE
jgi:hypothetical protein